ncbi:MAG: hypothetical protein AAB758_01455 [Patescibacteria group bacterium]
MSKPAPIAEPMPAPNTIVVKWLGEGDLEMSADGGIMQVSDYTVLAVNIDPDKEVFTYDIRPVPEGVGGIYTEAINEAVAHLPRTRTRRASQMRIVGDSELAELQARGVEVIFK